MEKLKLLYRSLGQRKRPEDIAEIIIDVLENELSSVELKLLEKAATGSLKRNCLGYTFMASKFAKVLGAEKQIKKAIEIFKIQNIQTIDYNYVPDIENFIRKISVLIYKKTGSNNFIADRLNKEERKKLGLES